MELRQLKYFLAVAEQLNFRKAAEQLYVTQPLLSKQIADLEHEIGTPLLLRNTRQVQLTPAGRRLKKEADLILRQVSSLTKSVQQADADELDSGTLRVLYEDAFDHSALVDAVRALTRKHPGVKVQLYARSFHQCISALNAGGADCAFIVLPDRNLSANLVCQVLHSDTLCLVAREELLRDHSLQSFLDLAQQTELYLLEKSPKGVNLLGAFLSSMSAEPEITFAEDLDSMLLYAEVGIGVTVVPHSAYRAYRSPYLTALEIPGNAACLCMACAWNEQDVNPLRDLLLDEFLPQERHCRDCQNTWCRFYP